MKIAWILFFISAATSAQTMFRCSDPDGRNLSFRPHCPVGQVAQKVPRHIEPTIRYPEVDVVERAIANRKEQEYQAGLERGNKVSNAIALKQVLIGMYSHEVERAWGRPDKVNITTSGSGKFEQWIYRSEGYKTRYVYLDNDVVRSIQSSE